MTCIQVINGQDNSSVEKVLKDYMNTVRKELYSPMPDKLLYNEKNSKELLDLLNTYYTDTLAKVRLKAYYLAYKSTYKLTGQELRNKAVYNIVQGLKDPDSGNVGNAAGWLTNFKSEDFSDESKDSIRSILRQKVAHREKIIKLAGFLNLKDEIEYIKSIMVVNSSSKFVWACHLTLARMGVEDEIGYCVDMVKKQGVNDDVIYELIPDLIYTKQKESFDYIIEILNSNEKNCFSANPENPQKILCGYRVMEFLAPVIKDFPLEVDSTGDLLIDDYEEALKITREWFVEHSDDYVILKDAF